MRNVWICPECGKENPATMLWCILCGFVRFAARWTLCAKAEPYVRYFSEPDEERPHHVRIADQLHEAAKGGK